MQISDALTKAINDQIQKEWYSSYLYLAMAAQFEADNLAGFAHWMKAQADEEREHGMRHFKYLVDRGGRVVLGAIDKPPADFGKPVQVFEKVLEHEQYVTASINSLYELALKEKDYPTQGELQWFIKEQVEEENIAEDILRQLQMIGDHPHFLLMMDRKLGERG